MFVTRQEFESVVADFKPGVLLRTTQRILAHTDCMDSVHIPKDSFLLNVSPPTITPFNMSSGGMRGVDLTLVWNKQILSYRSFVDPANFFVIASPVSEEET